MQENFKKYLINRGYKQKTPSGKPSTVYDYAKRVDAVCRYEGLSWIALAKEISRMIDKYDTGGECENLGKKSHHAVINALKRFEEFLQSKEKI